MSNKTQAKNAAWAHLKEIEAVKLAMEAVTVTSVKGSDSIESVVKKLKQRDVLSAPVLDDKQNVLGVIDLSDLLSFLCAEVAPSKTAAQAEHTMRHRDAKAVMLFSPRDVYTPLAPRDKASMLAELFATGVHRCPLVDTDNKLVGLVTQVDAAMELIPVLRDGAAAAMGKSTLLSLGLGLHEPVYCHKDQEVGDTLAQLDAWQISALAVCDDAGKLVANFSVTNLVHLWSEREGASEALSLSVYAYLQKFCPKALAPLTCKRTDSLIDSLITMVDKQVHRLWVVDADGKPIGVVTFTDLFKLVRDYVDAAYVSSTGAPMSPRSAFGVIFRTPTGEAVSLDDKGEHVVLRDSASDEHSIWQVEHLASSAVALRASNGKYLAVDDKHHICLLPSVTPSAHWNIMHLDTGFVALRAAGGDFLEPFAADKRVHSSWFHASKAHNPTKKQLFKMTSAIAAHPEPVGEAPKPRA